MFGMWELLIILVIVLLVFGARRLPMLGKGFGEALTNFKKAMKDGNTRDVEELEEEEKKKDT